MSCGRLGAARFAIAAVAGVTPAANPGPEATGVGRGFNAVFSGAGSESAVLSEHNKEGVDPTSAIKPAGSAAVAAVVRLDRLAFIPRPAMRDADFTGIQVALGRRAAGSRLAKVAPRAGLEPATRRLTAACSTN